jgi:AraC-like DNA-binding protein
MPTQLVGRAVALVRRAGGDADGLIQAHDLPGTVESDPFILLSVQRLRAVLDGAARAARDSFLGVNIARQLDDGNVIAFACRGALDLRSALSRAILLLTAISPQLAVTFVESSGLGRIDLSVVDQPLGLGRHGNEYWVTSMLLHARRLTADPCVPERVWFAHPAPRDRGELERALGTSRVKFGAARSGFVLAARALDAPLRPTDPRLRGLLDRSAPSLLAPPREEDPFVARVRRTILEQLPRGAPAIDATARACGVSARTLQRRLSENGTTFRRLLDAVRSELSAVHIEDPDLSLDQVASLVGFSQASGLVRAFRRWNGTTPRARGD